MNLLIRFAETSTVEFLPFERAVAEEYTALVPVLDKAGSYAIQDHGEMIIKKISGDYDNVVGLPATRLKEALEAALKVC